MYGIFHDWVPHLPLMVTSMILLILFPFFSKDKRNALVLLAVFVFPIGGLYLFCKLLNITHFITSRYFVSFLPLFLITIYLALNTIEVRFNRIRKFIRLEFLFLILFIASNLIILPLYYRSEKQNIRGWSPFWKITSQMEIRFLLRQAGICQEFFTILEFIQKEDITPLKSRKNRGKSLV